MNLDTRNLPTFKLVTVSRDPPMDTAYATTRGRRTSRRRRSPMRPELTASAGMRPRGAGTATGVVGDPQVSVTGSRRPSSSETGAPTGRQVEPTSAPACALGHVWCHLRRSIPFGYRLACGMLHDAAAAEDAVREAALKSLAETVPSATWCGSVAPVSRDRRDRWHRSSPWPGVQLVLTSPGAFIVA